MGRNKEYKGGFLFKGFYADKRVYNLCEGYWKRSIQLSLRDGNEKGEYLGNRYGNGRKIYDANPIAFFLLGEKAVRIVVESEENYEVAYQNEPEYNLSAYLDKYTLEDKEYTELVVSLFMCRPAVEKAKVILTRWLTEERMDKKEFEVFIEEIIVGKREWTVKKGNRIAAKRPGVRHIATSVGKRNKPKTK